MRLNPAIASIPTATLALWSAIRTREEAMDQHLARVTLENTEARHQDVTVDLVFDGNKARRGLAFFGVWQDRNDDVRCPFVLDPTGDVDFGTGYDGSDRWYRTNVAEIELFIGQQVDWGTEE